MTRVNEVARIWWRWNRAVERGDDADQRAACAEMAAFWDGVCDEIVDAVADMLRAQREEVPK